MSEGTEKNLDPIIKTAIEQALEKVRHPKEKGRPKVIVFPEATYAVPVGKNITTEGLEEIFRRTSEAEKRVMLSGKFPPKVPEAIKVYQELMSDISSEGLKLPSINSKLIKEAGLTPKSLAELEKLKTVVFGAYGLRLEDFKKYEDSVKEEMLKML